MTSKTKTFTAFCAVILALPLLGAICTQDKSDVTAGQVPSTGQESGGSGTAGVSGSGDCAHDYYPLKKGYSVIYRHALESGQMDYTMTVVDASEAAARMEFDFSGTSETGGPMSFTQELTCSGGNLTPDGYLDMSSAFGDFKMRMDTDNVEGMLLPKSLAVGTSWTTSYDLTVTPEEGSYPMGQFGAMKSSIRIDNTVESSEAVTVPAGTYQALKVRAVTTTTTVIPNLPGDIPPTETQSTSFQWFVKGVGVVKMESNDGAVVTEAVEVRLP